MKQFRVRFSPTQTKAFIFKIKSATQANYDAALGVDSIGYMTGFGTVEGEDVSIAVPVRLLPNPRPGDLLPGPAGLPRR